MTKQNHLMIEDSCIAFCGQFTGLYVDRRPNTDLSFLKAFVFKIWSMRIQSFEVYLGYSFCFFPSSNS